MMIEISALPPAAQQQTLAVEQGQITPFVNRGKIIGNPTTNGISLMTDKDFRLFKS